MPDYSTGKIYQIISPHYPLPYIGSTVRPLSKRLYEHKSRAKKGTKDRSSRPIIDAGEYYIELIEEYPCRTKEELNRREGEIIRERECVNRRIAGRTWDEYVVESHAKILQRNRDYHHRKREEILPKKREYYQEHKEHHYQQCRKRCEERREIVAEYQKAYRQKNKERIALYKREYYKSHKEAQLIGQ